MKLFGLEVDVKNTPKLDPSFLPILKFNRAFLETAEKPVSIALERSDGQTAIFHTKIHGTSGMEEADSYYIDRLVKTALWMKGGFRIYVSGDGNVYDYLKETYKPGGRRGFDADFMADIYERPFEVIYTERLPEGKEIPKAIGGHLEGCRIGFDAGGSDRKVSALINGKSVYSEEVVWFPKTEADPDYHYDGIVSAFKSAAAHLPRVDAVGVSSAGIYINNRTMKASLFRQVPDELFEKKVKDIYIRAIRDTFGKDIPFAVANDGDVSALAGMMSMGEKNVLGIAMGTSEAAGYVDSMGRITGWLNELAFVPVDCGGNAFEDDWSHDYGCGAKYFSQDAVIALAPRAGIELSESLSPAEKLKAVQSLIAEGKPAAVKNSAADGISVTEASASARAKPAAGENAAARDIYMSIGTYLGHSLAFYHDLYGCSYVLLLGRVMSGKGGDIILSEAKRVIADEYEDIAESIFPVLPDEKFRRLGQSAAAASLAEARI